MRRERGVTALTYLGGVRLSLSSFRWMLCRHFVILLLLHLPFLYFFFFFNDTATTEIYTLSLHDALPIWRTARRRRHAFRPGLVHLRGLRGRTRADQRRQDEKSRCNLALAHPDREVREGDRKSTRLNSSHQIISYAVFCLKKKKKQQLISL